jgi:hypothetical protein
VPLLFGAWLANVGDPGIGRRFVADVRDHAHQLRQPAALAAALRTSMGLAAATAIVGIPSMVIWRRVAVSIALAALSLFSVADPLLNVFRRSWWMGALVSAGTWMALFITFAATANAIEPMREGAMVFLLPMMIFAGALPLSGIVRLIRWAFRAPSAQ